MTTEAAPRSRFRQTMAILLLCRVPFWERSRTRRIARFLVLACYLYVGTLLVLLALEDRFLFPGATFGRPWRKPPATLQVRELILSSAHGERIHAWFSAPEGWLPKRGAILFSHGNGGNLSRISGRAFRWRQQLGRAVLLYDYPGYGKSSGRPSEAAAMLPARPPSTGWSRKSEFRPARSFLSANPWAARWPPSWRRTTS
ncbi:MAG TPA: hypothetical protein VMG10_18590 [Gemmataceae bacterium]|nr:hypothetical protein [Gemmataceae bacterium]